MAATMLDEWNANPKSVTMTDTVHTALVLYATVDSCDLEQIRASGLEPIGHLHTKDYAGMRDTEEASVQRAQWWAKSMRPHENLRTLKMRISGPGLLYLKDKMYTKGDGFYRMHPQENVPWRIVDAEGTVLMEVEDAVVPDEKWTPIYFAAQAAKSGPPA